MVNLMNLHLQGLCVVAALSLVLGCASQLKEREVRYPDGTRRVEHHVDGVPHGSFTIYRPSGAVAKRGSYKRGKQHGLFISYDSSGNPEEKILYDEGRIVWRSSDGSELAPAITGSLEREIVAPPAARKDAVPLFPTLDLTRPDSKLAAAMSLQTPGEGWGQGTVLFASTNDFWATRRFMIRSRRFLESSSSWTSSPRPQIDERADGLLSDFELVGSHPDGTGSAVLCAQSDCGLLRLY